MQPPQPPKIAAVDVVPAQPAQADSLALTHLSMSDAASPPEVAYVVKVKLKSKPPVTSLGWALYVNDVRIPKYWEYEDGIYFTVTDPNFFALHKGKRLRFSHDDVEFHDTGTKLPGAPAAGAPAAAAVATALKSKTRAKPKAKKAKKAKAKSKKSKSKSKRKAAR